MTRIAFYDFSDGRPVPQRLLRRADPGLAELFLAVRPIIDAVRDEGDAALIRFAREFEHVRAEDFTLRVSAAEIEAAVAAAPPKLLDALRFAAKNIRTFHEAQKPPDIFWKEVLPGVFTGERWTPLDTAACYAPRNGAVSPAAVLMTAIPAQVAGVRRIILLTPPRPDGQVDPGILAACGLLGLTEIYKAGGAQAVAAAAHGTETVPACDKFAGPGNPFAAAAKRLLADIMNCAPITGAAESLFLADETADAQLAALDLIAAAEHGRDAVAWFVTGSRALAEACIATTAHLLEGMQGSRAAIAQAVLGGKHGGVLLTRDFDSAIAFANEFAPQTLHVLAANAISLLPRLRHAGEILLGPLTPPALSHFGLGLNAVLPGLGAARTQGPLSVFDFAKRTALGAVGASAYVRLAAEAGILAAQEGLAGHAAALATPRLPGSNDLAPVNISRCSV